MTIRVAPGELLRFATAALHAAGARPSDAAVCAEVLVAADLSGVDTHGVARLDRYVGELLSGAVDPAAVPVVTDRHGARLVVDAGNGLGPPALCDAVDLAVDTALVHGVAAVSVRRSRHVGMAGWYAERAAERGLFAMVLTGTTPMVTPPGAATPLLGTNPIAYAVPAPGGPVCFDAATSVVPRGTVERADRADAPLPPGWAADRAGRPARSPADVLSGLPNAEHCLLPLGAGDAAAHKGFGLGLLVQLLCGPAPPGAVAQQVLCLTLDSPARAHVTALVDALRSTPPLSPAVPVRAPGDHRRSTRAHHTAWGIPLPTPVLTRLAEVAHTAGVPPLAPLPAPV